MASARVAFFQRYSPVLLTLGVSAWLEALVKVEWSLPYCLKQDDGPMPDAFGMPLPDEIFGGVSSMEYDFMPHIYLLNILVLSCALFPVLRRALDRFLPPGRQGLQAAAGWLGLAGLVVILAAVGVEVKAGALFPVQAIGSVYGSYADFRPVALRFGPPQNEACIPSRFWFGVPK